ncbi:unnamed protein product [Spirodela intermedia]|uniref:CCHC-type domain-containing protein n=1 Tax=Spirodela intermedia TaxID=51605 RepID=A0A7I8K4P9_SPIIN|nr:unnamed protein product [Spirodela intermedia]
MHKKEVVVDFAITFTHIILDLRNLGETMEERKVVWRFLQAMPSKFDALTLSMEQYVDLDKISLDEAIGSLTIHELRLKERESQEEKQALLARVLSKAKFLSEEESSSRGRGRHCGCSRGRGRGHGRSQHPLSIDTRKHFDKSQIQCYNCEKFGHFTYEC